MRDSNAHISSRADTTTSDALRVLGHIHSSGMNSQHQASAVFSFSVVGGGALVRSCSRTFIGQTGERAKRAFCGIGSAQCAFASSIPALWIDHAFDGFATAHGGNFACDLRNAFVAQGAG